MAEPHNIWQIPELVEHIILHLPLQDILRAQAVSQTLRDIITSSPTIRRALFLAPLTKPTRKQLALLLNARPMRVLGRGQFSDPNDPGVPYDLFIETTPTNVPQAVLLNPLFDRFVDYHIACHDVRTGTNVHMSWRHSISLRPGARASLLANPPTASWRNMLLIQPQAAAIYEMPVHPTADQGGNVSHHSRIIPIHHAGCSVREFLAKEEVHQWRRELSSLQGRRRMFADCTLCLRTGMSWQLGSERVEEIKDEQGYGVMVRAEGNVSGWDVICAADALEAEGRKLEELKGLENAAD